MMQKTNYEQNLRQQKTSFHGSSSFLLPLEQLLQTDKTHEIVGLTIFLAPAYTSLFSQSIFTSPKVSREKGPTDKECRPPLPSTSLHFSCKQRDFKNAKRFGGISFCSQHRIYMCTNATNLMDINS